MPLKEHYKTPLMMYIVWHPANAQGMQYAEALYNSFCRDTHSPLSRGLNIPLRFRFSPHGAAGLPVDIDTSVAHRTAIVLLVDEEMFADGAWVTYIRTLLQKESETVRMFPVALSDYAFSFDEQTLKKKQFINLTKLSGDSEERTFIKKFTELRSRLLHDLSRFFFKIEKLANLDQQTTPPPVKLFVSHAKVDGENLAKEFRNYVQQNTKLKTFFDVNDIADAEDFEQEIKNNLSNSAIVVFLSDKYSTREWCRIEVLVAKRNKSPIVVVNNLQVGEKRSFPYLGNVPTLRYNNEDQQLAFNDIVDLALFQVLNNLFFEEKLKEEIQLYDINKQYHVYSIENAPELFNYIDIKLLQQQQGDGRTLLVLYPDPPLGTEELRVLSEIDESIQFITPSLIHKTLKHGQQ